MIEEEMWKQVQENRIMIEQLEDRVEELENLIVILSKRILVLEKCEGIE